MDNEFWGMEQAYYKAQRKKLEDLRKENAELKAKIADGVRVYAHQEFDDAWWCNTNVPVFNATLILDEGWDK